MTLTLDLARTEIVERILAITASSDVIAKLHGLTNIPVDVGRPVFPKPVTRLPIRTRRKLDAASNLLRLYASAHAVVTDRLHVALPCLASGTPVLFVHPNLEDPRFGGLIDHLQAVTPEDFAAGRFDFNFENPPPNADSWRPMAHRLRTRCEDFIRH